MITSKHWGLSLALMGLVGCDKGEPPAPVAAPTTVTPQEAALTTPAVKSAAEREAALSAKPSVEQSAFRDAAIDPPKDYAGLRFKLSADYPTAQPGLTPERAPWLKVKVDFGNGKVAPKFKQSGWAEYMKVVLDYVKAGQDPNLDDQIGFRTSIDDKVRWYNVPWMAFDLTAGREYVHGCTNERTAHLEDLEASEVTNKHVFSTKLINKKCEEQNKVGFESWSVGFYNDLGGWAIGQAFPRNGSQAGTPQTTANNAQTTLNGLPFPEGTLVTKILTTSAPPDCVATLVNAPAWTVDRHHYDAKAGKYTCVRELQTSYILQVDVAMVDARSPTRWVYGTFVYDGGQKGATFWDRLLPLGVQWGSDPDVWPAVQPKQSKSVTQTVLNPGVKTYQHEGCNGRLAGPVDNPQSSCMSCHADGYAVAPAGTPVIQGDPPKGNVPPIFGFEGLCPLPNTTQLTPEQLQQNKDYFANYPYPALYPGYENLISMDTSLQLQEAMQQYAVYETNNSEPQACTLGK